jgi:hypothetical protein
VTESDCDEWDHVLRTELTCIYWYFKNWEEKEYHFIGSSKWDDTVNQDITEMTSSTILWHNRPMREVMKFRNLKECDCATVAECRRVLPLHPSPIFAPVLLGYAVTIGSRNSKEGQSDLSDVTHNNTQRCVLRVLDSSVDRRDWRQCSASC